MSIIVGKRNFAENFSKMSMNDFSRDHAYRSKLIMNENTLINRHISTQSYLLENARTLKQHFQQIDDKEIMTVLDDCDNNIDIAMEILQKSTQPRPVVPVIQERNVKKIGVTLREQKIENKRPRVEEKKQETVLEEEIPSAMKTDEVKAISEHVVQRLQSLSSLDEAKEMMAMMLFDVINETEKRNQGTIKKLNGEKAILIKAFAKQRVKAQTQEEKNTELSIIGNNREQEIARLKTINYKLELRLRALDMSNEENHNYDVY